MRSVYHVTLRDRPTGSKLAATLRFNRRGEYEAEQVLFMTCGELDTMAAYHRCFARLRRLAELLERRRWRRRVRR